MLTLVLPQRVLNQSHQDWIEEVRDSQIKEQECQLKEEVEKIFLQLRKHLMFQVQVKEMEIVMEVRIHPKVKFQIQFQEKKVEIK